MGLSKNESVSHRIISPSKLIDGNRKEIKQILNHIAKKYNVSIEDAAFALSNTLKSYSEKDV